MKTELESTIEAARGKTLAKAVAIVSEYVNRVCKYIPPNENWNTNRWSAPERTLEKGGNCLDLAVLKMSILLELRFSEDDIFIGRTVKGDRINHAVLLFDYPHRNWCFSKPVIKTWVADINPPFFYRLEKSKLVFQDEEFWRWSEIQKMVDFDRSFFSVLDEENVSNV